MATKQSTGKQEQQVTEKIKQYTYQEVDAVRKESDKVSRDLYSTLSNIIPADMRDALWYCVRLQMPIGGSCDEYMKSIKAKADAVQGAKKALKALQRAKLKKSDGVS